MKKFCNYLLFFVFLALFCYVVASWDKIFLSSEECSQVEVVINSLKGPTDLAPNLEAHPEYLSFSDDMMTYYYSLLAKRLTKSGSDYWFDDDSYNKLFLKAVDEFLMNKYRKKFNQFSNKELDDIIHHYELDICECVHVSECSSETKFAMQCKYRGAYDNVEYINSEGDVLNQRYFDSQDLDPSFLGYHRRY